MNDLFKYLKTLDDTPYHEHLQAITQCIVQNLIEIDLNQTIDALPYERNDERATYRNGYRERQWRTRLGRIPLKIPKLRQGTYYPDFIRNPDFEATLTNFVQQIYLFGLTQYQLEAFLTEINFSGVDIHAEISDVLNRYHHVDIADVYTALWLHVFPLSDHDVAVIAVGMDQHNTPRTLAFDRTRSLDNEDFWQEFLEKLVKRGLTSVNLVISGAYRGIKRAVYEAFPNADWHYSQIDCLQDLADLLETHEQPVIIDAVSHVYDAQDYETARERLERLIKTLKPRQPQAALWLEFQTEAILNYWQNPQLVVGKVSLPEQPQMAVSILDEQYQPRSIRVC